MLHPLQLAGRPACSSLTPCRLSSRLVSRLAHRAALCHARVSAPLPVSRRRLGLARVSVVSVACQRSSSALTRFQAPTCAAWGSQQVEFETIPEAVRERSLQAVESLGGSVTVGDVAGRGGLTVAQSEAALRALAADTGATLKVSEKGDLLYVFQPRSLRGSLAAKSWRLRFAPAVRKAQETAAYLVRVAFGVTLVVSVLIVSTAIYVLLQGKSDEREGRGRGGRGGGGISFRFSPFDFMFWDPFYWQRARQRQRENSFYEMGFLETVFSFVFGDGDPNEELESRRWTAVGELIQENKGVVTAEQLAPLLEPPPSSRGGASSDESFVLPALVRLNGTPEVSPAGDIVYRFSELATTARRRSSRSQAGSQVLKEAPWQFTAAPPATLAGAVLLGVGNAAGVVWLSTLLRNPSLVASVGAEAVRAITTLLPGLQLYALLFFAIPAGRYLLLQARNAEIEQRNEARREAAGLLARPTPELQAKLQSAAAGAERVVFDAESKSIFSSDVADAGGAEEAKAFDRLLEERAKERDRSARRKDGL